MLKYLSATYTYDLNGNRSSLTYANGNKVDYAYNLANLVTSLHNKNGTNTLSKYDYTYYLDGNQATKADNKGRLTSYTYDGLGRLSREAESGSSDAITKAYTFDSAGNRSTMAVSGAESYNIGYAYDLSNRLTTEAKQIGSESEITDYYYDNNGNTIAKKTGTLKDSAGNENLSLSLDFKGSEVYQYDGFDRMIGVQNSSGSSIYTYKPDGYRISKSVNGVTTTHVWEGQNIALDLDVNGEVSNRYIRGTGLINSDENGWYLFNGHGDVVQLANNAGAVTKEYAYDAFGNEKNVDDTDTNPFRYSGEYYDEETGSIYLRARYYNPSVGRFNSADSYLGNNTDPLSLNLYTYCTNNPISFYDPTGHMNYWTQSHLLLGGYEQRAYEIASQFNPNNLNIMEQAKQASALAQSVGSIAKSMYNGDMDWNDLASLLGDKATDALIGDLLYLKDNYNQFSTDVDITDDQAWALGQHTAGAIYELEQAGFTIKSLSSALKGMSKTTIKSNLGNKIDITTSVNHSTVSKNPGFKGKANSSIDIVDKYGNIKTRRWFGSNGKAFRDVDMTNHGNSKLHPEYPHEHFIIYNSDGTLKKR